jgi:3-isopropylmalate dehydrogenase
MDKFTTVTGVAAPLIRPNVDTEVIIRIDRLIEHDPQALGAYCFESLRRRGDGSENPEFVLNQPRFRAARILIAADNFGCGSSREAAVWALRDLGIRCVIAPSFGDIFYENCFQNGLLPVRISRDDMLQLALRVESGPDAQLTVDLISQTITTSEGVSVGFQVEAYRREALLSGRDEIDTTLREIAAIREHRVQHRRARPWAYPASAKAEPKVLLMAGDGIGPEIMAQAKRVALWFRERCKVRFELREALYGIDSWKAHGAVVSKGAWTEIRSADAIIFGASGSPDYDAIPVEQWRPDNLLRIRRELGLYANLRPVRLLDSTLGLSTLRPEVIAGADFVIVRELTGGLYFGEPRGISTLPDGQRRAINTMVYTTQEIERVARVAFDLARVRRGEVCSVDKANVLEASELWRETVERVRDREYPDVMLRHLYVDNAAMQLVRAPSQFDVMLTENLFGDILSDCAAMVAGSIGMLPSASLGTSGADGRPLRALYEPIHGSAPDITGRNIANPIGTILSFGMCLQISLGAVKESRMLEEAVANVVRSGVRTADIAARGNSVSTTTMGSAIVEELERLHREESAEAPHRPEHASPATQS